ncbi:MAG: hypothetical protein ABIJ75_12285 [Actinomycetota bacterium]
MRHTIILGVLVALVTAACGGGSAATGTTGIDESADGFDTAAALAAENPAEFVLTDRDDGALLRVHPGDVIAMRLPVEDPANPLWILATEPDPAVVAITDSLLWTPSEPGSEPTHFEFVFWVIGTGTTGMTFSLGAPTPTSPTVIISIESTAG